MATPYDLENIRLMREGLSPLVNLAGQEADLARAQYLRELALQDEATRTFRAQDFARAQQDRQIAGAGRNQMEAVRAQKEAQIAIAKDYREAQKEIAKENRESEEKRAEARRKFDADQAKEAREFSKELQKETGKTQLQLQDDRQAFEEKQDKEKREFDLQEREKDKKATTSSYRSFQSKVERGTALVNRLWNENLNAQESAIRKAAAAELGITESALKPSLNKKHLAAVENARLSIGQTPQNLALAGQLQQAQASLKSAENALNAVTQKAVLQGIPLEEIGEPVTPSEFIGPPQASTIGAGGSFQLSGGNVGAGAVGQAPAASTTPEFIGPPVAQEFRGVIPTIRDVAARVAGTAALLPVRAAEANLQNLKTLAIGGNFVPLFTQADVQAFQNAAGQLVPSPSPEQLALQKNAGFARGDAMTPPEFYSPLSGAPQIPSPTLPATSLFEMMRLQTPPASVMAQPPPTGPMQGPPLAPVPQGYMRLADGRMAPILPTTTSEVIHQNPFQRFYGPFLQNRPTPPMLSPTGLPVELAPQPVMGPQGVPTPFIQNPFRAFFGPYSPPVQPPMTPEQNAIAVLNMLRPVTNALRY